MELDVFQIMPDHMHCIIILTDAVGATLAVAQNGAVVNPAHTNSDAPDDMITQNNDPIADETGAGQALPLRTRNPLATLLGHINHWWQMIVWKYSYKKIRIK